VKFSFCLIAGLVAVNARDKLIIIFLDKAGHIEAHYCHIGSCNGPTMCLG
jgi:hypothetical protein